LRSGSATEDRGVVNEAKTVFLVVREPGMAWVRDRVLREQPGFAAHSAFMDGLFATGSVLFGGPLTAIPNRIVLVASAKDREAVYELFRDDPWLRDDVLRLASVHAWEWHLEAA
jgi:uncharacterized protein YciI